MRRIETTVEIGASPERVWGLLTDFDSMPQWNPFIREIKGVPKEDERIRVTIHPPEGKAMTFKPTVLRAEANRELRWPGRLLLPRIFDGEHYFLIDDLGSGRVRLTHGEVFRGLLVSLLRGTLDKTEEGFEQMNKALKEQAEMPAESES